MNEQELNEIERRCIGSTKGPSKSLIERRDTSSGSSFIMTTEEDIYLSGPLLIKNQDFIAHAKQDIPRLIAEIRRLKNK